MNLFLHNIGSPDPEADPPIDVGDSLIAEPSERVEMVLTNPPFGRKSSVTMIGEDGRVQSTDIAIQRQDFWATTSNKQLNFLQHVRSMLKIGGTAAIVVPDNVLFEGGAGETIRRRLFQECDVHTMLRLPTGIFYAQGVKANVLFFERKGASAHAATEALWVYDLRTNQHFTLKTQSLKRSDLEDFVLSYSPGAREKRQPSEKFKRWTYEDLADRPAFNLDIWAEVQDESLEDASSLPAPEVIADEIVESLTAALDQFSAVAAELRAASDRNGAGEEGIDAVEELLPDPEHRI
jgi:type I restriction enzyme M protein